ncbi:MAG TPA: chromosome segregation protein SMC [Acidimicrobiales bacterium]|nr:chromosome segregation protein SMC [Acidimicrobiales bacterium]
MFLKSLTIKGFKSFADTTTLELEPGVTVVVGPNGSGKSNVVDAVAWVLGAQGARTVRSAKMEDVIFAGTPKRPALGRAEVSLTIDNSAGLLPIDFSEVTITRTLFRNGDSEYAINRVPCRLLDIQELLSDTGIGRQQHVIVSQGNLDGILNARPEERRLVIEEAAGILKYRRRKEKAERRLESTEASLVRLQDLLREVRRQLRPLEKQADAARRHDDLVAELAAVRRHLHGRDLTAVEGRLAGAGRDRRDLAAAEEQVRRTLARLDAEVLEAETRMEEAMSGPGPDLADVVSRAEGLRARANGLAAVLAERRRSIERALNATVDQSVISSLEAEAASLAERLAGTEHEAERLLPEADELTEAERVLAAETEAFESQWGSAPSRPTDPAAEVRGELTALRSASDRSGAELRRLDGRLASLEERVSKLASERARLAQVVDETGGQAGALAEEATAARRAEEQADTARAEAEDRRRQADAEHHRWAAREEALAQALDQARARAGAERLAAAGGVVGTLLDLVEVEDGFAAAFEAAAGEILAAVVLDGVDSARRGLDELRRTQAAGAVVALPGAAPRPDGAPRGPGGSAPAADLPDGATRLRGRVRGRLPGVDHLLDDLLGPAVVVEAGWEAALDLALAQPRLVVVTPDGDRFSGGLWRTGAAGPGATGAALEEARERAAAAAGAAERAAVDLRDARQAHEQARTARAAATRAVEANTSRARAAADALARVDSERAERTNELEAARAQRQDIAERIDREAARVAELEALLPELQRLADAEAEKAAAERAARYRLSERAAAVAATRKDLEVRAAGLEERRALTARRLKEVEERLRRNVAERDEAAVRRQAAATAAGVTDALTALVRSRESALGATLTRLREARRAESEEQRARSSRLEQLRRERSAAERQLSEVRERLNRVDLDEAEARVRLENITEAIRRDLDSEPESVRGAECPPLPAGTSATSRRTELERELRLMGPINPLALEEYNALVERHQFLDAQLEDVRAARRELTKVIKAIDAEITEVFGAAYADVAENFVKLFATLFPGGEGRLKLTDPEHLLETGIEVEARPSGKNLRRLSLLSGGERSLVAMAFLFAVFRSRPSPFYMMDEVEAALDDVNLHRFLGLIAEFRDEAQLLIVSHQKRTMEAADCLYGVTMAPGGSSRVVSERVSARAEATADA